MKWLREIETYCSPSVCKVLVGNKVDRVSQKDNCAGRGLADARRSSQGKSVRLKGNSLQIEWVWDSLVRDNVYNVSQLYCI